MSSSLLMATCLANLSEIALTMHLWRSLALDDLCNFSFWTVVFKFATILWFTQNFRFFLRSSLILISPLFCCWAWYRCLLLSSSLLFLCGVCLSLCLFLASLQILHARFVALIFLLVLFFLLWDIYSVCSCSISVKFFVNNICICVCFQFFSSFVVSSFSFFCFLRFSFVPLHCPGIA